MEWGGLKSCTLILRLGYDHVNNFDVVDLGVPWSLRPPKSLSHLLFTRFTERVRNGLKRKFGRQLRPTDLYWELIRDRKTVKRKNYDIWSGSLPK